MIENYSYNDEFREYRNDAETYDRTFFNQLTFSSHFLNTFGPTTTDANSQIATHQDIRGLTIETHYSSYEYFSSVGSTLSVSSTAFEQTLGPGISTDITSTTINITLSTLNILFDESGFSTFLTLDATEFVKWQTEVIISHITNLTTQTILDGPTSFSYRVTDTVLSLQNTIREITTLISSYFTYPIGFIGEYITSSSSTNLLGNTELFFTSKQGTTSTFALGTYLLETSTSVTTQALIATTSSSMVTTNKNPFVFGRVGTFYSKEGNESLIIVNGGDLNYTNRFSALSEMGYDFTSVATILNTLVSASPIVASYVFSLQTDRSEFQPLSVTINWPDVVQKSTRIDSSYTTKDSYLSTQTSSYKYFIPSNSFPIPSSVAFITTQASSSTDSFDITDETAYFFEGMFPPNENTFVDFIFYGNESYPSFYLTNYPFITYSLGEGVGYKVTPQVLDIYRNSETAIYRRLITANSTTAAGLSFGGVGSNSLFGVTYDIGWVDITVSSRVTFRESNMYEYSSDTFNGKILMVDEATYTGKHFYVQEFPGFRVSNSVFENALIAGFSIFLSDGYTYASQGDSSNKILDFNTFSQIKSFLSTDLNQIFLKFTNSSQIEATVLNQGVSAAIQYPVIYQNELINPYIYYSSRFFSYNFESPIIKSVYSFGGPNIYSLKEAAVLPPAIYLITTYDLLGNLYTSAKETMDNYVTMECMTNQVIKFQVIPRFNFFPIDPERAYSRNKLVFIAEDIEDN